MPRTKAYNVRLAEPKDSFDIAMLAKSLVKETGLREKLGFDWRATVDVADRLIEDPSFFLAAADDEGEVVGFLAGAIVPTFFNPSCLQATELGWYVAPMFRNTGIALDLHKFYEDWAISQGATVCNMMHMENDPDRIGKMYNKMGYHRTETAYMKEL